MKISLTTLISLQIIPTLTIAATVKNIVVFGDSNSDVGSSVRWSDGPLWSEYLAAGWNVSLYSFAYSGSVCDSSMYKSTAVENQVPSLKDQMEAYYNLKLNLNPEETVYAFWFGYQDVYEMAKRHGRQEPEYKEIAECIGQQLRMARKVFTSDRYLVLNVPPLGHMPYYQEQGEEIAANRSQASVEINRGLEKDVANLNKHHHALEMDYVDIHSMINDIVVDPKIFNFKNPVSSYLDQQGNDDNNAAKDYIWWDKTHFTTAFHKMIAKSILEAESYMSKVVITSSMEKQLFDPKSRFHSKKYTVKPGSSTGALEELGRIYDLEKATPTQPVQPPLEDDLADYYQQAEKNAPESRTFAGLFIVFMIVGGIIAWIKFPNLFIFNWIRSKLNRGDRGKFIPVNNREEV